MVTDRDSFEFSDLTIVVITHNRRRQLRETLRRHRTPVIVIDNGSNDGTADMVRRCFPHVRLVALPRNLGAAARNIGVQLSSTSYVAFADDDSWWDMDSLDRAVALFNDFDSLGAVAARVFMEPGRGEDPFNQTLADSPLTSAKALPGPRILGFMACSLVTRRSAYLQANGFEKVLGIGGEETTLAIDLASNGWDVCYVAELIVHHEPRSRPDRGKARRRRLYRNDILNAVLRRPLRVAAGRLIRQLRKGPDGILGALMALPHLPEAFRHRRVVDHRLEKELLLIETAPHALASRTRVRNDHD